MNIRQQLIAFYTLVRHEWVRMFRIASQVFLPAVTTTSLYFLIFGTVLGKRVGLIHGVPYSLFIAPGLIMMTVITNAYSNVSGSLFAARFQRSIEELLVSPLSNGLLLSGYVLGGDYPWTFGGIFSVFSVQLFCQHPAIAPLVNCVHYIDGLCYFFIGWIYQCVICPHL